MNLLNVLLSGDDRKYFTEFTEAVTNACKLSNASAEVVAKCPCKLSFDPVKPGGIHAYPAVWTQDFTMIFSAGFLAAETGLAHLRLILGVQNGSDARRLDTGAVIPPCIFSIPTQPLKWRKAQAKCYIRKVSGRRWRVYSQQIFPCT